MYCKINESKPLENQSYTYWKRQVYITPLIWPHALLIFTLRFRGYRAGHTSLNSYTLVWGFTITNTLDIAHIKLNILSVLHLVDTYQETPTVWWLVYIFKKCVVHYFSFYEFEKKSIIDWFHFYKWYLNFQTHSCSENKKRTVPLFSLTSNILG